LISANGPRSDNRKIKKAPYIGVGLLIATKGSQLRKSNYRNN